MEKLFTQEKKYNLGKFTTFPSPITTILTYTEEHSRSTMAKICEKNERFG